jgi:hypothetical protein
MRNGHSPTDTSARSGVAVTCMCYVTAVAVGQRQRLCSGVIIERLSGITSASSKVVIVTKGPKPDLMCLWPVRWVAACSNNAKAHGWFRI